ncbi:FkbM family methyltransferase [Candidatus Pacearchaeota archaeon]|nr:FkbM family methyltransferase [Candidatus Pacearchaeota archaeon]
MNLGSLLSKAFEKFPEWPIKNDIRYFLAFNRLVPSFVSDLSPVKGYELNYHIKPGDIVVDAGAFTGDYTVFAAKRAGPHGKVLAFEPDAKNRKILAHNLNHEGLRNVIIIPKGLWNKNTKLQFSGSDGLHSTLLAGSKETSIDVVKLDDELKKRGIRKVDVIKMDIEGAEIEAIQGSLETLKKNKVHVIIASYHIVDGKRTSYYIEDFLRKHGYQAKSDFPKHLTTYGWKP